MGLFFPFIICLHSSLFVPALNEQKVSDLIARSWLLIAIYMFKLLVEYLVSVSVNFVAVVS